MINCFKCIMVWNWPFSCALLWFFLNKVWEVWKSSKLRESREKIYQTTPILRHTTLRNYVFNFSLDETISFGLQCHQIEMLFDCEYLICKIKTLALYDCHVDTSNDGFNDSIEIPSQNTFCFWKNIFIKQKIRISAAHSVTTIATLELELVHR